MLQLGLRESVNLFSMEQNIVVYIGIYKALGLVGSVVGAVGLGAWYASGRLTKVETKVDSIETGLTNLQGRMDNAFGNTSPISLLVKGREVLEKSGLKSYIDKNQSNLFIQCKSGNNLNTQYDIQEAVFKFFDTLDFGEFDKELRKAAYTYGTPMNVLRRIGAIYFRDICLKEHGFTPEDLDKPCE